MSARSSAVDREYVFVAGGFVVGGADSSAGASSASCPEAARLIETSAKTLSDTAMGLLAKGSKQIGRWHVKVV